MKGKLFTSLMLAAALLLPACGKSDAALQKAATDQLAAAKITGVTVTVKNGVATVSGEVADISVKNKAEISVKSCEGITSVTNNINVKAPSDPILQGKVDEALQKAGCAGAKATIANDVVTLTGSVPEAKYAICFQAISEIGGVRIDNQLQKNK
jgi:hyperosmotically inducible protein